MKVEILVLDYERPVEAKLALNMLKRHAKFEHTVTFLCNGSEDPSYAFELCKDGLIDKLLVNWVNNGAGLGAKQLFKAAESDFAIFHQVDQYMNCDVSQDYIDRCCKFLIDMPKCFCVDLSGNQGGEDQDHQLRYSDRAHLIRRDTFLNMPGIDDVIGGVGPFAANGIDKDKKFIWTEEFIQNHIHYHCNGIALGNPIFSDNGKHSIRQYPIEFGINGVAPKTLHYTDEKTLFILKPFGKPFLNSPNLLLDKEEWEQVLSGSWPKEGKIPNANKGNTFKVWKDVIRWEDFN